MHAVNYVNVYRNYLLLIRCINFYYSNDRLDTKIIFFILSSLTWIISSLQISWLIHPFLWFCECFHYKPNKLLQFLINEKFTNVGTNLHYWSLYAKVCHDSTGSKTMYNLFYMYFKSEFLYLEKYIHLFFWFNLWLLP